MTTEEEEEIDHTVIKMSVSFTAETDQTLVVIHHRMMSEIGILKESRVIMRLSKMINQEK